MCIRDSICLRWMLCNYRYVEFNRRNISSSDSHRPLEGVRLFPAAYRPQMCIRDRDEGSGDDIDVHTDADAQWLDVGYKEGAIGRAHV